jgi:pyruvate dehydrogenase E1 component alpha subunit
MARAASKSSTSKSAKPSTATKSPASKGSRAKKATSFDNETLLSFYRDMLLIRRFEERAGQMYGMGLIGGFCHLYIGQEAVVIGMQSALDKRDSIITGYRDHGHMLATGMESRGVMAELTGRRGGYSKGKGGSMHMFSREKRFFGGHGIVAAQVSLGGGLAFANKYRGEGGVSVTYFGDGASNQGQVAETMNIAALWKLPLIFVIENNKYGMGTSVNRSSAGEDLYKRGQAYGIPGEKVDGMNVMTVAARAKEIVEYVRENGPYVLEMETYRYRGHSMSDPAKYRSRDEVNKMREERDPIETLRDHLLSLKALDADGVKQMDVDVRAIVADAAEFAQQSPEPDPSELFTEILLEA